MHSTTQTAASMPIRNGGMLARLADKIAIAAGASLTAWASGVADGVGFDSALVAFSMLFALLFFPSWGMYRVARTRLFWRCVCIPFLAWLFVLGASCVLVMALHRGYRPAAGWLREWACVSALGIVACRVAASVICLRIVRQDSRTRAVAIVGSAVRCRQLMRKVNATKDSSYRVAAAFDTNPLAQDAPLGLPTFCDREAFAAYIRNSNIDELWLAVPLSEGRTIVPFVETFRNDLIDIRFIPDVSGMSVFNAGMTDIEGTSAINLIASPIASHALIGKELFDRAFALCALIGLAPVLAAVALAVKCSSPGPVFFTQRRKGANGKIFSIYKFRSMRIHVETEGTVKQATRNDPRVTRVGAFLRRTSLDELPQFFNVLRGEMSVVGPRPHAIEHDKIYQDIVDGYIHRYRIKPGITGWAQVNGSTPLIATPIDMRGDRLIR